MPHSLWRNDTHLGEVVLPLPTTASDGLAGVFVPSPAFTDLAPFMQVRQLLLPGQPVFQHPITHTASPGPVTLTPMSEADARGVPASQHFELRDAAGTPLLHRMIMLDHLPPAPDGHPDPVKAACRDANVPYSDWYLHAAGLLAPGGR